MFQCRESETLNKWCVCWRGEWPEVWGSQPTRNNYEMSTRTVRSGALHHLPSLKAGQSVLVKHCVTQQWLINDLLMHFCHMPETSVTYFIDANLKKKKKQYNCRHQSETRIHLLIKKWRSVSRLDLISDVKWEIPAPRQRIHTMMMIALMTGSETRSRWQQQEPTLKSGPLNLWKL